MVAEMALTPTPNCDWCEIIAIQKRKQKIQRAMNITKHEKLKIQQPFR